MAIVLDAFASYVADLLKQVVDDEVGMLLGVTGEIDKMGVKLGDLKNFLADAERRHITDSSVQSWVTELRRAMYDATDILDICQLKAMDQHSASGSRMGCCNPLLFCLRNPLYAHNIGSRIKALNQKLNTIKERSATFGFINIGSYEDRSSKVHSSRLAASRETSGELNRSGVVREKIQEDTRKLVDIMLTEKEGNSNIKVVAIVGTGGIGKTTLAKKVFNDEAINAKFDTMIWLSINKDFDKVELLRTAITRVGGDHRGEKALAMLQPTLTAALTGKKLLLVMDDVWSHEAWSEVLETPMVNAVARGSRVLITTRDERVARGMKAVLPYHHVDRLEEEDAWTLLKKQVVSSETDGPEIDMLKDIGLQIVAKCGGLPLAIKVMGGLLCRKDKQRRDWQMVLNDSIWSEPEMPEELNNAVYLSYEDLPPSIKQCFLFYSLLPKPALFFEYDIIGMWISEGFLHGTSDDLEELGRKYHKELILRNLIEPDEIYVDQVVCNMHDVVRSFAQFVARDEALAAHSGESGITSKLSAQKFLRLSLESEVSESAGLDWSSLQAQKTLRTLISAGHINMKPGDTLVNFPCLRTLHIDSANVAVLVYSLDQLKHLRYLSIERSDIARLPDNIGKMKFLQHISLLGCQKFLKLPHSILKLEHLRFLNFIGTSINGIPRGFCVLTNLRNLIGFPAEVDGDWCSLEELGPLSQLRGLTLRGLDNVSTNLFAAKARLGEKEHLTHLILKCSSRLGADGMIKEEGVSEEEQRRIEEVFDEFCPPCSLDYLTIEGYFGRRLPSWMMSSSAVPLKSLRILFMIDLACCNQLPDGLSQLPWLEHIEIAHAPAIKRVGPEFLQTYHHHSRRPSTAVVAFQRLHKMILDEMVEWEEWEWEEQVQAFPVLEELLLKCCKLRRVPPGLASHARALKKLYIAFVQHLSYLENFASVVELIVTENPDLERISNLPSLQKLAIHTCPKLDVLKGVSALQRLVLQDYAMGTLPEYMRDVNPRHLELRCSLALLTSIATGESGPEWDKFSHVEHVKAYAGDGDNPRKWYVVYTREPCNLDTNTSRSFLSGGTLLSSMVEAQGFESVFKMRRRTFSYVCCLVNDDMMVRDSSYTFADGRVMCLEDRVAVALTLLNSGEPPETVGSSVGMNESTVWLVTESFLDAMWKRKWYWPDSRKMEKIKYKFDKIHGLPNCCGVIHTTHIPFGRSCDHEKNNSILMQVLVDPDMRFTSIWLGQADSMNQSSILLDSPLFKECKKGELLNGNMLKVSSDGSEVGEYVIGDAGYPLLPWLLTPYQEEDLSESKAEFNRRHSAARTLALQALARLEDTWKCLHRGMWCSDDTYKLSKIIHACCKLHNRVIDMEEADMARSQGVNYSEQVRRLADEDAIRVRDILSQHLIESGVDRVDEEEEQEVVSSGSGDKEEQEAHRRTGEEGRQC